MSTPLTPNLGISGQPIARYPMSPTGLPVPNTVRGEMPLSSEAGAVITPHRKFLAELEGPFNARVKEIQAAEHLSPVGKRAELEQLAGPLIARLDAPLQPNGLVATIRQDLDKMKARIIPSVPTDPRGGCPRLGDQDRVPRSQ